MPEVRQVINLLYHNYPTCLGPNVFKKIAGRLDSLPAILTYGEFNGWHFNSALYSKDLITAGIRTKKLLFLNR